MKLERGLNILYTVSIPRRNNARPFRCVIVLRYVASRMTYLNWKKVGKKGLMIKPAGLPGCGNAELSHRLILITQVVKHWRHSPILRFRVRESSPKNARHFPKLNKSTLSPS